MKNLAEQEECDIEILKELQYAGISVFDGKAERSEVPYTIIGKFDVWNFVRAWSYWVAKCPDNQGLKKDYAQSFDKIWGSVVRVDGSCVPVEIKNTSVDLYHIDTEDGLKAFIGILAKQKRDELLKEFEAKEEERYQQNKAKREQK